MPDIADLITPLAVPSVVPASVVDDWRENAKRVTTSKTKPRWDAAVSDPMVWNNTIAADSNKAFSPFVNPLFVSSAGLNADEIKTRQLQKLQGSHQAALAEHDSLFANDAAEMKARIDRKQTNFSERVVVGMSVTGTGVGAGKRGPGVAHVEFWADTGNDRMFSIIRSGDTFTGDITPATPFVPVGIRAQFRAALMNLITQATVGMFRGDDVAAYNTRFDTLITAFLDPAYSDPPLSFIHLEIATGPVLHSHVQTP